MGDKVSAKAAMKRVGIPCVPGSEGELPEDPKELVRIARSIGYPVIIKAAGGGGGRGGFSEKTPAAAGVCQLPANPNPQTESMRALLVALTDWVTRDVAPPPSDITTQQIH